MMQLLPKGGGDETSPARPSAGHVGRRAGSHRFCGENTNPMRQRGSRFVELLQKMVHMRKFCQSEPRDGTTYLSNRHRKRPLEGLACSTRPKSA